MVSPSEAPQQEPSTAASIPSRAAADAGSANAAAATSASAGLRPETKESTGKPEAAASASATADASKEEQKQDKDDSGVAPKSVQHHQEQPLKDVTRASVDSGELVRDDARETAKKKDGGDEKQEQQSSTSKKKRRTDGGGNNSDFPKTRNEMPPDMLRRRIRRQVEYYLSDESLMFDPFFQGRMREAARQGLGEALEIKFVLTSPRMQQLNITQEEILAAVEDSPDVKVKRTEDGRVFLYRETPLPELRGKIGRRGGGGGGGGAPGLRQEAPHGLGKDCHAVGCFLRVRNIPAEVTQWQQVKDALRAALPEEALVRFVSSIEAAPADSNNRKSNDHKGTTTKRQCWVLLAPFEDDRVILEKQQPIKIKFLSSQQKTKGDEQATASCPGAPDNTSATTGQSEDVAEAEAVLMSEKEVRNACSEMPPRLRTNHERDVQQLRRQLAGLPLLLKNEVKFNSVEHLRKCVAEFLQKTSAGERLRPGGAAEKAVLALLDYHPKAFFKKGAREKQVIGAKVGLHEKTDHQGHQQKCFFVIRKHVETGEEDEEDFSVNKCIAELAKDPPCEREALAQLLKTRNGLAAEKRSQAAAQAAIRKRNREEAVAKMAAAHSPAQNVSPASPVSPAGAATGAADASSLESKRQKQQQDEEGGAAPPVSKTEAGGQKHLQAHIGEKEASKEGQLQQQQQAVEEGAAAAAAVVVEQQSNRSSCSK